MISAVALAPGTPAPAPGVAATDNEDNAVVPDQNSVIFTAVLVVVGCLVGVAIHHEAFTPVAGISVFAAMYVVAQVIERLQEPFVPWVGRAPSKVDQPEGSSKIVDKASAHATRDKKVVEAINNPGDAGMAKRAAEAQRVVDQIRANLTLVLWGSSSALAMLFSGLFGLYLLKGIGVFDSPTWLDIAITGLAVGGGTKPLHDLITNISESKKAKQDPPETA
jgi:hypothetical protein